jgi:uncharacterized protein YutE (UPF0331/DUF86 family)
MRHITVHHYEKIDDERLFNTIKIDIPKLKLFCKTRLDSFQNQDDTKEAKPKPPRPRFF